MKNTNNKSFVRNYKNLFKKYENNSESMLIS